MKNIIEKAVLSHDIAREDIIKLINCTDTETNEYLFEKARETSQQNYGNKIFLRGLIEISNICKNNCFYCGIRAGNKCVHRYRLSKEEILNACDEGSLLGLKTFVLQGGEDSFFTDEVLEDIICEIKNRYPYAAVTLSLGERSYESYLRLKKAGADRYLLRHEAASKALYENIHPKDMYYEARIRCLENLKRAGYQTGCGFMVGVPMQTYEDIADDVEFIKNFKPEMVGIGPFVPHKDTPFGKYPAGDVGLTLRLLALIRILLPEVLLPATTALGTVDSSGHIKGVMAGANVIMPNLTPIGQRQKYMLYNNKASSGVQAAEGIEKLKENLRTIGYEISFDRGDNKKMINN